MGLTSVSEFLRESRLSTEGGNRLTATKLGLRSCKLQTTQTAVTVSVFI